MNTVHNINGPVIKVLGDTGFQMMEMVYVGKKRLVGEVIGVDAKQATIQVYENTTGLKPGEPVVGTGAPLSVTLGPGLIGGIYDGIERPLDRIAAEHGAFIPEGIEVSSISAEREFDVTMKVKAGDAVTGGQIYATTPETSSIEHRVMIPPQLSGTIVSVKPDGKYRVNDTVAVLKTADGDEIGLTLCQKWPIKQKRPVVQRMPITRPLITGQRVIDTLFPVGKGGAAAVPGGFGTGKTMTQHQLAKWSDADLIVYIGCGERGNEMTQVLTEFSELTDPRTGKPMTDRTILIANTSNMPVAAREASIYTGITLAEYYRDMGYDVAIMADSTSRWAEALREISGRLEEMPAEEGFPAYLPSRLAAFYERAGSVENLNGSTGSVTIIGAVSPQGSDFSEPVTQNTKRFVRSFWALDKSLAYARHYPAINWTDSYSEYAEDLEKFYRENVGEEFVTCRRRIMALLTEENSLQEIVKLIGADVLPDSQKLVIEIGKVIRVGYLQQNAYHADDTYVSLQKQMLMMQTILKLYDLTAACISRGVALSEVTDLGVFAKVTSMKYTIPNSKPEMFASLQQELEDEISKLH